MSDASTRAGCDHGGALRVTVTCSLLRLPAVLTPHGTLDKAAMMAVPFKRLVRPKLPTFRKQCGRKCFVQSTCVCVLQDPTWPADPNGAHLSMSVVQVFDSSVCKADRHVQRCQESTGI